MSKIKKAKTGWTTQAYIGIGSDGKRIYKRFSAETKNEVEYLVATYKKEWKRKSTPSKNTLGEAMDRYIESKSQVLSPATIAEYIGMRKRSLGSIMDCKLADLTQEAVQLAINDEAKRITRKGTPTSPKTIKNIHGLLTATLAMFMPDFNLRTTLPLYIAPEITVPENEQVVLLLNEAKKCKTPDLYKGILLASCIGGLRRSEACAVKYSDIDEKNNTVTINKAIVRNKDKEYVEKLTKTKSSTRVIKVDPSIIKELTKYKETDKVVNCLPGAFSKRYDRLRKRIGIDVNKIRFHHLRHYHASVLEALNIPVTYAKTITGHSSDYTLKRVYQHAMQAKKTELDDRISAHFSEILNGEKEANATDNATANSKSVDL